MIPYICLHCWWYPHDTFPETILSGSGTTDANGELALEFEGDLLDDLLAVG